MVSDAVITVSVESDDPDDAKYLLEQKIESEYPEGMYERVGFFATMYRDAGYWVFMQSMKKTG